MASLFQYRQIRRAIQQKIEGSFTENWDKQRANFDDTAAQSVIIVNWSRENDPTNPVNYSTPRKAVMTLLVSLLAIAVTASSSIDACGVTQYSEYFNVSGVLCFLIGFGIGSLFSGPFSETFGRSAVYLVTMFVFLLFVIVSALAPTLQSHLIFRVLAGFFGSTPLTCAGGTVADLWNPLQKTYAFLLYAVPAFGGPVIGQTIGSFVPITLGWRWLEWIMLIMEGLTLMVVWKAAELRKQTGNDQYRAPMELQRTDHYSYGVLYLTIVYMVLFSFLEGYTFVFGRTYSLSQGLTSIAWVGMLVGELLVSCVIPLVYSWTCREYKRTSRIRPEARLWYATLGDAPAVPISLFWMGWTSCSTVTIWSPLIASVLFGYGITTIFLVAYMYIIDCYRVFSASALGFVVFSRYIVAGAISVAGAPIYCSLGVHALAGVIPYLLYVYGPSIRKHSKYATKKN
ncbi:MFS general substrate transporter [Aspergillus costaricaensis CBS 115574]|uniref:MFS general substrate transporter n=1 Tax=Aspergillus costaricaensis CBS 115574 TaxID=1448317 RepID=A0ACD1IF68_9EURO|nr:MFS general substrate transporter [Aspergillus costaricaensis CBS 115574]RAK88658.1 MFS general substrate transporter [Aspergillus costaricaensis CBS 115574]